MFNFVVDMIKTMPSAVDVVMQSLLSETSGVDAINTWRFELCLESWIDSLIVDLWSDGVYKSILHSRVMDRLLL